MIANHIQDLITATKALPNSLNRNKAVSHLEDALAHMKVLESEGFRASDKSVLHGKENGPELFVPCICKPGMFDQACELHGVKR